MARAYELELHGEALKAWSQNLGHEKLDTSVNSYGNLTHASLALEITAGKSGGAGECKTKPSRPESLPFHLHSLGLS